MLTGESIPAEKFTGSKVTGGTVNQTGSFTMRAEKSVRTRCSPASSTWSARQVVAARRFKNLLTWSLAGSFWPS